MALNTTFVAGTTIITASHLNGLQSAWTAWTPTISAGSGTFTTVSTTSARWQRIGKTVLYAAIFQITTAGTAAAGFRFTLPATPHANSVNLGSGRESASTGFVLGTNHIGAGVCEVTKYDNTTIIANGRTLNVSGSFEIA